MYDPNSPKANQLLSQSQPIIQNNFAQIQNSFDVNHYDFDEGTDNGKHMYVEMPAQSAAPPILFAAGEIATYSFLNAATGVNELYVNKTNEATVVQVPMTASTLSLTSLPNAGTGGWTYLPSGLVLVWGNSAFVTPGGFNGINTATITLPITIQRVLSVVVCPFNGSTTNDLNFAVRVIDMGMTSFRVFISSRTNTGAAPVGLQVGYQFTALCIPS